MIAVRGHHLFCILTYAGAGYSKKFVKNFDALVDSIHNAGLLRLVEGADRICSACRRYGEGHDAANHSCWSAPMLRWDRRAIEVVNNTLKPERPWKIGSHILLTQQHVSLLRREFIDGQLYSVCAGCDWFRFCRDCAVNGDKNAKLFLRAQRPVTVVDAIERPRCPNSKNAAQQV